MPRPRHPHPKHVHRETTRHGKTVYYYRKPGSVRVRLDGDYDTPEFWKNYALAASGSTPPAYSSRERFRRQMKFKLSVELRRDLAAAKTRAAKRGLLFNLSEDWALEQIERQDFKCALTGIPFSLEHEGVSVRNPYTPSFDRIDNAKGYTVDNVRIVTWAINSMISDWGEEVFYHVANAYRYARSQIGRNAPIVEEGDENALAGTATPENMVANL